MPGNLIAHQFLAHIDKIFIFGGRKNGNIINKCFVINIQSSELEPIMNLENPTQFHTLHYKVELPKAYICGGRTTDDVLLKDCSEFDIADQKLKTFG